MALVMKFMDMNTALNARLVCKSWKKLVSDANLQPLEANLKGEELQTGLDAQSLLLTNRRLEDNIWTQSHACSMRTHLSRQETVTEEMRTVLVNWLIEVHFKFRYREPCLHLTIQVLLLLLLLLLIFLFPFLLLASHPPLLPLVLILHCTMLCFLLFVISILCSH